MGVPPVFAGATQLTVACSVPGVAVTLVGASGTLDAPATAGATTTRATLATPVTSTLAAHFEGRITETS